MTNTYFFYELSMLADDAMAFLKNGKNEQAYTALENLARKLDEAYNRACNEDVPDDVDESNYNPFIGSDEYEDYNLGLDI